MSQVNGKATIVSPVASVRFPNLESTEVIGGVDTEKYGISLIFKPEDKEILESAISIAGGGRGKSPLKEMTGDYDTGMYSVKAKTSRIDWVNAVDASGNKVELSEITHGSDVRVKLTFARYEMQGGGVTCYLGDIQLLKPSGASTDFGPLPDGYEPGADLDDPLPF
jgi:hypothetical protein